MLDGYGMALVILAGFTVLLFAGMYVAFTADLRRERPERVVIGPGLAAIRMPSGSVATEDCKGGEMLAGCYKLELDSGGYIYAPLQWTIYREV